MKNWRLDNLSIRPDCKELKCQAKQFMIVVYMIDNFVNISGMQYILRFGKNNTEF